MKRMVVCLLAVLVCLMSVGCAKSTRLVERLVLCENGTQQASYIYGYDKSGRIVAEIKASADGSDTYTDYYDRDEKGSVVAFRRVTDEGVFPLSITAVSPYVYDLCDETGAVVRRVIFDTYGHIVSRSEDGLTVEWHYEMGKDGIPKAITRQIILPSGQAYRTDFTVQRTDDNTYTYFDAQTPEAVYTATLCATSDDHSK